MVRIGRRDASISAVDGRDGRAAAAPPPRWHEAAQRGVSEQNGCRSRHMRPEPSQQAILPRRSLAAASPSLLATAPNTLGSAEGAAAFAAGPLHCCCGPCSARPAPAMRERHTWRAARARGAESLHLVQRTA
jgi:hypothetical protein